MLKWARENGCPTRGFGGIPVTYTGGGVFESALVHYVVVYVHRLSHLVLDDLRFLGRYDQTSNQRNGYLYSASHPPPKNQNHINSVLKTTAIRMRSYGPMAQWIRRRSTEPEIPGSIPGRFNFFLFSIESTSSVHLVTENTACLFAHKESPFFFDSDKLSVPMGDGAT